MQPLHIGITMHGILSGTPTDIELAYDTAYTRLKTILDSQRDLQIPLFSIYMIPEERQQSPHFSICKKSTVHFLQSLQTNHPTKITILGKWYDIPDFIEPIKKVLEDTKEYDTQFLNLCINYNGREEILDACKLIARKVQAHKLDPENITQDIMKENMYTSAFPPPNIIIKNGVKNEISGFLLWDSASTYLHTTNKPFPEIQVNDIREAITSWQQNSTRTTTKN